MNHSSVRIVNSWTYSFNQSSSLRSLPSNHTYVIKGNKQTILGDNQTYILSECREKRVQIFQQTYQIT